MKKNLFYLIAAGLLLVSCTKNILDRKPDRSQVVPVTLTDLQALLDNTSTNLGADFTGISEVAAGDYELTAADYQALTYLPERNAYTWQPGTWGGVRVIPEWNNSYQAVFTCNVVLDGLKDPALAEKDPAGFAYVKGQALFRRACCFYNVALIFAKAYDPLTAAHDPGIPLRLDADLNKVSVRSTLEETYRQITGDLAQAAGLLPAAQTSKFRPAMGTAYAELARVYLAMGDYPAAFRNADASLKLYATLLDYNTLNLAANYPLPDQNAEVLSRITLGAYASFFSPSCKIVPELYQMYDANDLRRSAFFTNNSDGSHSFRGSYRAASTPFAGLTTGEQYLIRAEGYARQGQAAEALADLNTLLVKRYKPGTFVPLTAADAPAALRLVLAERRKELVFRGLRWSDLKRLNREPALAVTLTRNVNGTVYSLPPGGPRYVFPIPDVVIAASGIPQN
jgi:tetratricopeptide (TPR) repeat protein